MASGAEIAELVAGAVEGRRDAWDAIVDRYAGLVWAVARGHGLSRSTAADVAQTTWLRLAEELAVLAPDDLGAWLAAAARRESVRALRWVDVRLDADDAATEPVRRAVGTLGSRCRLALRVHAVVPAPTSRELAAALDLDEPAAQTALQRCVERCSEVLVPSTRPAGGPLWTT